jgi:hypothetical protein
MSRYSEVHSRCILGALILVLTLALPSHAQDNSPSVDYCLGCHSTETAGEATSGGDGDGDSRWVSQRAVDPAAYAASAHGNQSCVFCHFGFEQYPHSERALARPKSQCSSCHRGRQYQDWGFPEIRKEFEASVHVAKQGEDFTCFACHNPHTFRPSRGERTIPMTVQHSNGICIECHRDTGMMAERFGVTVAALDETHAFLPNRTVHWRAVRCLDCHTAPNERMVSHAILSKAEAVHNCVECHSQDSRLRETLYRHQPELFDEQKVPMFDKTPVGGTFVKIVGAIAMLALLAFLIRRRLAALRSSRK